MHVPSGNPNEWAKPHLITHDPVTPRQSTPPLSKLEYTCPAQNSRNNGKLCLAPLVTESCYHQDCYRQTDRSCKVVTDTIAIAETPAKQLPVFKGCTKRWLELAAFLVKCCNFITGEPPTKSTCIRRTTLRAKQQLQLDYLSPDCASSASYHTKSHEETSICVLTLDSVHMPTEHLLMLSAQVRLRHLSCSLGCYTEYMHSCKLNSPQGIVALHSQQHKRSLNNRQQCITHARDHAAADLLLL